MPWLFFAAAAVGIALYFKSSKAPAVVPKAQANPTGNPLQNLTAPFFGEAQKITRTFTEGVTEAQQVAATAQASVSQFQALGSAVSSGLAALGSAVKVMPGVFKDLGVDNTGSAKQTPGGLTASMFHDPDVGQNQPTVLDFGSGSDQPNSGGLPAGAFGDPNANSNAFGGWFGLGADPQVTGENTVNDLGVDTSSVDSVYPNLMSPGTTAGTAGTVADAVQYDPYYSYDPAGSQLLPDTLLGADVNGGAIPDAPGVDTVQGDDDGNFFGEGW